MVYRASEANVRDLEASNPVVQNGHMTMQLGAKDIGPRSRIGMGCASLGSRVGRREGLNALARAWDSGITWFDVAPSYGDAEAEAILGDFVQGKRDKLRICTKVGIRPARTPLLLRAAKPVVRAFVGSVPMVRKYVTSARPKAKSLPITAELISASLDESLQRLRTDHVEVLALHEADENEVVRDDILAVLERIVRSGKAKTISIASSLEAGLLGVSHSSIYQIIQVANNPFEPSLADAARRHPPGRPITFVTHSAYGAFGALDRLRKLIDANAIRRQALRDAGYRGSSEEIAAAFLADYALATNEGGITLFSMFKNEHLAFNLHRLEQMPAKARLQELAKGLVAA
jgi:aryl-alcohol dehydrogenase-like predicted oxidoreductase